VNRATFLALTLVVCAASARAEPAPTPAPTPAPAPEPEPEPAPPAIEAPPKNPDTVIRQKRRDMFKTAGSVQLIEEDLLETTEYDDPQSILQQVPGVYARGEDGYGLRPNIGIRGVTSERSQKVTLLEDGLLFGPAPYSAPAGYFFPLMTRMVGLEILKGPAAILHGPNTIGGAVNVLTRQIPRSLAGGLDLALGSAAAFDNAYFKGHAHLGTAWAWGGVLAELVHLESTGFKELDSASDDRPNTGFSRTEVMLKANAHSDLYATSSHKLELKLGFAREVSNETYLGLTDADFAAAPNRRYVGSELDRMRWNRFQAELQHTFAVGPTELVTTAYWRDFSRAWKKLNRFRDGPSLDTILNAPTSPANDVFHRILTGADDSLADAEALMIGTNDRRFSVLGLQTTLSQRLKTGAWRHKAELSLRLHYDAISRLHTEDAHAMTDGRLVRDATPRLTNLDNDASSLALATYFAYGISGHGWTFTPGARLEWIQTRYTATTTAENSSVVVLPGLGLHRELAPNFGVFAGLYRGFSPVAPGQASDVSPETSLNWELGLRWLDPDTGSIAELVGFWNDYENLVGTCTFSSGCAESDIDRQFNGGAVTVLGLEAALAHRFALGRGFTLPVRLAYTLTDGVFNSDFSSENPQFGRVEAGDHLPYVPTHQLQVQLGLAVPKTFSVNLAYTFIDAMREEAGKDDTRRTDAAHVLDLMGDVGLGAGTSLYLRAENLLMQEPIASRRPFGARPGKPFVAQVGFKWRFGATE